MIQSSPAFVLIVSQRIGENTNLRICYFFDIQPYTLSALFSKSESRISSCNSEHNSSVWNKPRKFWWSHLNGRNQLLHSSSISLQLWRSVEKQLDSDSISSSQAKFKHNRNRAESSFQNEHLALFSEYCICLCDWATENSAMFPRKTLRLSSQNCLSAYWNSKGIRQLIKILKLNTNT